MSICTFAERCPWCGNQLAPGTIHHLRRRGPSVVVCQVVDVESTFESLADRIDLAEQE